MLKVIASFQEDVEIINLIDSLAREKGTDRSALIRQFIREGLEKLKETEE